MLLCLLAVSAKLSLIDFKISLIYGGAMVLFSWFVMPYAITSGRNEIALYLSSHQARQYVAILVTLECIIALAFAFRQKWNESHEPARENRYQKVKRILSIPLWWLQKYYVSLLILPTLFYIQTQLIYALPGVDFKLPALMVGGGALLFFPLMGLLFRWALPVRSMREELVLSLSVLLCLSALFSTITEEMLFAPAQHTPTPFLSYLLALLLFLTFFGLGLVYTRRKKYKSNQRNKR